MNRKTQAQREAINKRADAYPRPISPLQYQALAAMAARPVSYTHATGHWNGHLQRTMDSLEQRGLCRIKGKQRPRAIIAAAGRRELARHRGAP